MKQKYDVVTCSICRIELVLDDEDKLTGKIRCPSCGQTIALGDPKVVIEEKRIMTQNMTDDDDVEFDPFIIIDGVLYFEEDIPITYPPPWSPKLESRWEEFSHNRLTENSLSWHYDEYADGDWADE